MHTKVKYCALCNGQVIATCAADGQVRVSEVREDGEAVTRGLLQVYLYVYSMYAYT
jgi:hypothetical protein